MIQIQLAKEINAQSNLRGRTGPRPAVQVKTESRKDFRCGLTGTDLISRTL